MTSECSICLDDINAATGCTTLSCGHTFHFACVARWFVSQSGNSSCSLCRKEVSKTEDLPYDEEDEGENEEDDEDEEDEEDDEDDDEDEGDDDDDEEEEEQMDPAVVRVRVEAVKARLATMNEEAAANFAATKIQSICRRRLVWNQVYRVCWAKRYMERMEERLRKSVIEHKIATEALRHGRGWKKYVALKFQAIWRSYRVRNVAFAVVLSASV
jgi:hypothetical protein